MQIVVNKIGLTRRILRIFDLEVNKLLSQGYRIVTHSVTKGPRILCSAVLEKPDDK